MKLVTPQMHVEDYDSFKNDLLNRRPFGEALCNLVERSDDELVIALNGKWGEGKTTFTKMWQGLLLENNIPSIYINAFDNDYIEDAFMAIACPISAFAQNNIEKTEVEKVNELKGKIKDVGCKLLTWSTKVAIKTATLGAIKESEIEELKDIKSELSKDASNIVGDFIEERLESHSSEINAIQSFRKLLSEIPGHLKDQNDRPLVVIIDELDRCKPSFAVEIIEKVKHLFSVKNVVFVLVMHKEQLEEAVKCIYGQNIDANTYLQKFINFEARLPKRAKLEFNNDYRAYCSYLFKLHELETWGDERNLIDSLVYLSNYFNLSLRQIEKSFTNIAIFYATSEKNYLRIAPLISFLAIVKVVNPSLYSLISENAITFSELLEKINLKNYDEDNKFNRIINWIQWAMLSEDEYRMLDEKSILHRFDDGLWSFHFERNELLSYFSSKLNLFEVND